MPKKIKEISRVEEVAKKADISIEKAEVKVNDEEKRLSVSPTGRFLVLPVAGGLFRVAKNRQWISPAISSREANTLCADMNRKDPEQKPYNRYLNGPAPAMRGVNDIQGL